MLRSLRQLEGWQQASLIGMAAGTLWLVLFRVPSILFNDHSLSVPEVLRSLGGVAGIYFLVFWAWGIRFTFATWQETWRDEWGPIDTDLWPITNIIVLPVGLALRGLLIALEFLPQSIIFLERAPFRAVHALVSSSEPGPSGDAPRSPNDR
jgi:hypothetical protein